MTPPMKWRLMALLFGVAAYRPTGTMPIGNVIAKAESLSQTRTTVTIQGTVFRTERVPLIQAYILTVGDRIRSIIVVADSSACMTAVIYASGLVHARNIAGMAVFGPLLAEGIR